MSNSTVSIIIPMYNAEEYLEKCLNSIISQTYIDLEIIVIDDGSSDNSYSIAETFQKNDSRIVLLKNSKKGVSSARNEGIKRAVGKWIMFCDIDDWIESDLIQQSVLFAEKNALDYLGSGFCEDVYIDDELYQSIKYGVSTPIVGDFVSFSHDISYVFRCKRALIATPWAKLYKKEILEQSSIFFNEKSVYAEDFDFNLRVLLMVQRYGFLPIEKYHYYRIPNIGSADKVKNNIVSEVDLVYQAMKHIKTKYKNYVLSQLLNDSLFDLYKLAIRKMISETNKKERDAILRELTESKGFQSLSETYRIFKIMIKFYSLHLNRCVYFIIDTYLLKK